MTSMARFTIGSSIWTDSFSALASANMVLSESSASILFWASSLRLKSSSLPVMFASHQARPAAISSGRTLAVYDSTNMRALSVVAESAKATAEVMMVPSTARKVRRMMCSRFARIVRALSVSEGQGAGATLRRRSASDIDQSLDFPGSPPLRQGSNPGRRDLRRTMERLECLQHEHPAHEPGQERHRQPAPRVRHFRAAQLPLVYAMLGKAMEQPAQGQAGVAFFAPGLGLPLLGKQPAVPEEAGTVPEVGVVARRRDGQNLAARLEDAVHLFDDALRMIDAVIQAADAGHVDRGRGEGQPRRHRVDEAARQTAQGEVAADQVELRERGAADDDVGAVGGILGPVGAQTMSEAEQAFAGVL